MTAPAQATAADTSSLVPVLTSIIAAYLTSEMVIRTEEQIMQARLEVFDVGGNAFKFLAQRTLSALARRTKKRKLGPEDTALIVAQTQDVATAAVVDILQHTTEKPTRETIRDVAEDLVHAIANSATNMAARQLGWAKTWDAVNDDRTRRSHSVMSGQRVQASKAFRLPTGGTIRFPHDPDAPYAETVNCRCRVDWIEP